jgi:hypothetical protein
MAYMSDTTPAEAIYVQIQRLEEEITEIEEDIEELRIRQHDKEEQLEELRKREKQEAEREELCLLGALRTLSGRSVECVGRISMNGECRVAVWDAGVLVMCMEEELVI